MTTYELIWEHRELDEIPHIAYGIVAKTWGEQILLKIQDISTDRQQAEIFVNLCNTMNLSPRHLHDAVADFIVA